MRTIQDKGCDANEGWWAEEMARVDSEARGRSRDKLITYAVGYALVLGGVLWACLRWLV